MLTISFTPTGEAAAAINLAASQCQSAQPIGKKAPRRIRFEKATPATGAIVELVCEKLSNPSGDSNYTFILNADAAGVLVGKKTLTSGINMLGLIPVLIALFKALLKAYMPKLDDAVLESLPDDEFCLETVTAHYYFEFQDESTAYQYSLDLHSYLKVVLDSGVQIPFRKGTLQDTTPRVVSDPVNRNVYSVKLPFGQANVAIKRDGDEYPATFGSLDDVEARKAMRARHRCLLCLEIGVDLNTFAYTDQDGLQLKLPVDYRNWTKSKLTDDPLHVIWDQVLWEFWLNVPLATSDVDIERRKINGTQEKILDSYLAGECENILLHPQMPPVPAEKKKLHDVFVKKLGVNFLNPWAIQKLNQGSIFREELDFEKRFNPSDDDQYSDHALTKGNLKQAIEKLDAAMSGKPGWFFAAE